MDSLDVLIAAHEEMIMHLIKFSSEDASINEASQQSSPLNMLHPESFHTVDSSGDGHCHLVSGDSFGVVQIRGCH